MDSFALLEEIAAGRREPEAAPSLDHSPKAFLLDLGFSLGRRRPDQFGMARLVAMQPRRPGSLAVGFAVESSITKMSTWAMFEGDVWCRMAHQAASDMNAKSRH